MEHEKYHFQGRTLLVKAYNEKYPYMMSYCQLLQPSPCLVHAIDFPIQPYRVDLIAQHLETCIRFGTRRKKDTQFYSESRPN